MVYSGVCFLSFAGFSCCYCVPFEHTRSLTCQCGSQHDSVIGQLALGWDVFVARHEWFACELDLGVKMRENKHSNTVYL